MSAHPDLLRAQLWGDQVVPLPALRRGDWWLARRALAAWLGDVAGSHGIYGELEARQALDRVEAAMASDPHLARAMAADDRAYAERSRRRG